MFLKSISVLCRGDKEWQREKILSSQGIGFLYVLLDIKNILMCSQVLRKLNIELSCDPAILLLDICLGELKTYIHTKTYTWMFITELFIIAKKWKYPKCPSADEWTNKM